MAHIVETEDLYFLYYTNSCKNTIKLFQSSKTLLLLYMIYDIKGLTWRMREIYKEICGMTTEDNEINFDLSTLEEDMRMMIEKWERQSRF